MSSALGLLTSVLVVTSQPDAAHATPPAPRCPDAVAKDAAPTAPSEDDAHRLALACGKPVEVLSEATETTTVLAQPSGVMTLEASAEPTRVRKGHAWRPVDTTLTAGPDGRLRPVAAAADVVFSAGGEGPFATLSGSGADFSLSWPTALPRGVVSGDSVTYPGVYPDVDLVVRAAAGGFSHVLVVRSAVGAANPAVRRTTYRVGGSATVAEQDGTVRISGPGGEIARSEKAAAWDSGAAPMTRARVKERTLAGVPATTVDRSSVQAPGENARRADVNVTVAEDALTVAVEPALLDSRSFPIYIDPTFDAANSRWNPVSKRDPNKSWNSGTAWPREVARVGSNYDDHGDVWRSLFQYNINALNGKRIVNTPSLDALATHSGACAGENVGLWQINLLGTATWNGTNGSWLNGGALQSKTVKANNNCSGQNDQWVKYNPAKLKELLQSHANSSHDGIAFGLRMNTESGGHWAKFDPKNVKLKAEWEHKPHSPEPTRVAPGGNCNRTSPGGWINDNTPTLYGKAQDGDNTVKVRFDLTGPTDPAVFTSGNVKSNAEANWTTPKLNDGDYNFKVQGTDDKDNTGWSHACYFRVDATPPTTPTIRRTSGTPVLGQPVTLELSSSDALSGLKQFEYGVGVDARQHTQSSTGTTSITFTPEPGRTQIYVWAQDHAANYSTRTEFNFFTGRVTTATPQGVWRFNGDARDDSGAGNHLTLGDGVTFGADRNGVAGGALTLTGDACPETGPLVRGDGEFSVAGWVKLTDKSQYRALFSQVGSATAGFLVTYNPTRDGWEAALASANSSTPAWTIAFAHTATPLDRWQHVAATVDPVAKVLRLYIDGKLAAESAMPHPTWHGDKFRVGCGGNTASSGYRLAGSIDHVGVWTGLLSEEQIARAATDLPAGSAGTWQLRGDGANAVNPDNPATIPDAASWVDDPYGRARSALALNPQTCATTTAPAIRTDESFTVSTWVRVADAEPGNQTVIGQDASRISGFFLGTRRPATADTTVWAFMMHGGDDENAPSSWAGAAPNGVVVEPDRWTHLTGVYDAGGEKISLYVDGKHVSSVTRAGNPWYAAGPTRIGCAMWMGGPADRVRGGAVADVRIWRGALDADQVARVHGGNAAVTSEGMWLLDGPDSDAPTYLTDSSGKGRDLTISGTYNWVRDRGKGREGALGLELSGDACAQTAAPALRTDGSFTVAGWVLLEKTDGTRTVVSQAGTQRPGFQLDYVKGADRWRFAMAASDATSAPLSEVLSQTAPELGKWTHLAGVYDLAARKVRLYVDGKLQGEAAAPTAPWAAGGPTLIGCAGTTGGARSNPLGAVLDDVRVWTSTLHPDRIGDLANADLTPNPS